MSSSLNLIVLATSKSSRGADRLSLAFEIESPWTGNPAPRPHALNSLAFMMPCATQYAAQGCIAVFRPLENLYATLVLECRTRRPQAEAIVRRPASARRHGPRHRAESESVSVRRTAVQPRRQAARADADRDQEGAPEGPHHDGLCDPRPGRGDDAGRPRRGHEQGQDRADRHAERALP